MTNNERDALVRRVRTTLAERDAKYSHPDYDREPLETFHLDWRDLRSLCAEVERLSEDAARMDWLEREVRHPDGLDVTLEPEGFAVTRTRYTPENVFAAWMAAGYETLRSAVDAARNRVAA